MFAVMNDTKWKELRDAMYQMGDGSPQWRTRCLTNGYISSWDGEWFYHFSQGGFEDIEWVEIKVGSAEQYSLVLAALRDIHVPGATTEHGFKVFGYVMEGTCIEYI